MIKSNLDGLLDAIIKNLHRDMSPLEIAKAHKVSVSCVRVYALKLRRAGFDVPLSGGAEVRAAIERAKKRHGVTSNG